MPEPFGEPNEPVEKHRIANGLQMAVVESLADPAVRKTLNADPSFERLRYLIVLAAATEPPFEIAGVASEGHQTFNINQLSRIAKQLGLNFERYRGAERVFAQLEKSGLVKSTTNKETGFHTFYPTDAGKFQATLNLDRLRKVQELQSQVKTMQMTIKKQLTKLPPTVFEVNLGRNEFTIGTDEDNDLMVHDPYMSRKHARVVHESESWVFEDLNSRNGSWKIEPSNLRRTTRANVSDGDMYQLGSTTVRFRHPRI
jgi:NACalpha-BTF3-like transcription factor